MYEAMYPNLNTEVSIYERQKPSIGSKTIIGYIGLENLKFAINIEERRVNFDLNLNIDKAILKEQGVDVKLTDLLKFLLDNEKRLKFPLENRLCAAQFVCYRGLLSTITCTPYELNEPWIIVALLHKGSIYLCKRNTEKKLMERKNMTEYHKQCSSWGYKFEQFLLSDKPDVDPNPDSPVNENEEFSMVYSTTINNHRIIFGAETDGVRCDKHAVKSPPTDDGPEAVIKYLMSQKFVELKTCEDIYFQYKINNFRKFKALKWWCQSYLVGIDTIVCGVRNKNGIVKQLKHYRLYELTRMAMQHWRKNVCLNFLADFLSYVKRCMDVTIRQKHGDTAVNKIQTLPLIGIQFEWQPGSAVRVNRDYNHEDDPILMDWFLENYGKYRSAVESEASTS